MGEPEEWDRLGSRLRNVECLEIHESMRGLTTNVLVVLYRI